MQSCQSMSSFSSRIPRELLGICESWWVTGIQGVGHPQSHIILEEDPGDLVITSAVFLAPQTLRAKKPVNLDIFKNIQAKIEPSISPNKKRPIAHQSQIQKPH